MESKLIFHFQEEVEGATEDVLYKKVVLERANEYEQFLRLWLRADETKNKERFHSDYNDKFFAFICLIVLSSMFLFFDKFMFEEKKVPTAGCKIRVFERSDIVW